MSTITRTSSPRAVSAVQSVTSLLDWTNLSYVIDTNTNSNATAFGSAAVRDKTETISCKKASLTLPDNADVSNLTVTVRGEYDGIPLGPAPTLRVSVSGGSVTKTASLNSTVTNHSFSGNETSWGITYAQLEEVVEGTRAVNIAVWDDISETKALDFKIDDVTIGYTYSYYRPGAVHLGSAF